MHRMNFGMAMLIVEACLLGVPLAQADGATAVKAYQAKDYDKAYREFQELAELGHAESQRNLGLMTMRGEGVLINKRRGYAWIKLAADAGDQTAQALEREFHPVFADIATDEVAELTEQFGPERLRAKLMPRILPNCEYASLEAPRLITKNPGNVIPYPSEAMDKGLEDFVVVEFVVAADGRARDYRIITGLRPDIWRKTIAEAMRKWTWRPAINDKGPITAIATMMLRFQFEDRDEVLDYSKADKWVKSIHVKAEAGDPGAAYVYGLLLSNHPQYRKPWSDALPWIQKAAVAGIPQAQFQLGYSLVNGRGCEPDLDKGLRWLELAAQADSPEAQVTLARLMRAQSANADSKKPVLWLQRAAKSNDRSAEQELAAMLATDPDASVRDAAEALRLSAVLIKNEPVNPLVMEIYAAALAANGKFADAAMAQAKALQRAGTLGWNVEGMTTRQAAYAAGRAWTGRLIDY